MASAPRHAQNLRIVHVFRAPLGGLFRHVVDLAAEQCARGHEVGMFFDGGGRCPRVEEALARLPGGARLGVVTTPIQRNPGLTDISAFARFSAFLRRAQPDIVHGHGSKGGVYARASALTHPRAVRAYTPHGGSFNYRPGAPVHRAYMLAERAMAPLTDVFLFESAYIAGRFDEFVGAPTRLRKIVANGIGPAEFVPLTPKEDAADLLYVGELRAAKGIDTLLEAIARVGRARGLIPRAVLVGSGPDKASLAELAQRLGIAPFVSFSGQLPARQAFQLGRVLVVPSRAESLPYIVLEAAGAHVPMIATNVGGIPEIYGPYRDRLLPPDDPADLQARIEATLAMSDAERSARAAELSAYVAQHFSIESMANAVMAGYSEALALRRPPLTRQTATVPSAH
ncbi:MAG: glycosyltransferase family 1 protein [Bradyrhizobium sp.]|nr:MAG: glycosyltransferase family 1 protein [Bradyrhizobium sp.]